MRGRLPSSHVHRWALAAGAALLLTASAAHVHADVSDANRTAAEALFREARKLMGEGSYADACPKLADSQRLDPGIGTLLNLGLCYKNAGKTASAWSAYREAADTARAARQSTREEVAQREADALEPLLSKITLQVAAETGAAEAEIKLDGAVIPKSLWGVPMPVDPGEHGIAATAEGKVTWSKQFEVRDQTAQTIEIPPLEDAPQPELVPEPQPEAPPTPTPPPPEPSEPEGEGLSGQQIGALVIGGVGLAAIGVGSVFGLSAMSAVDDSRDLCSDRNVCTAEGVELRDDASTYAALATIGYGVGLAGLAGAAVLWFTNPEPEEGPKPGEQVALGAAVVPNAAGATWALSVRGQW